MSPYAKLAFRYIDSRSTPYVHGITPNLNGVIKRIGVDDLSIPRCRLGATIEVVAVRSGFFRFYESEEMNNIVRQEKEREEDAQFLSEGMGISLCVILNAYTSLDTNKNQLIDMHLSRLATNLDPFSNTLSFKKNISTKILRRKN